METTEQFLKMMEHPERYTDEQLREMLADDECRALYETMRLAESAYQMDEAKRQIDNGLKEWEWKKFEQRKFSTFAWRWRKMAAAVALVVMLSGIAYAAIGISRHIEARKSLVETTNGANGTNGQSGVVEVVNDSTKVVAESITFENVPLDEILHAIAEHYGKTLDIRSQQAHDLRLFYKWNKQATLESVLADLNNFEQVHLTLSDNTLIVEP